MQQGNKIEHQCCLCGWSLYAWMSRSEWKQMIEGSIA
jgi:hypothetical protein